MKKRFFLLLLLFPLLVNAQENKEPEGTLIDGVVAVVGQNIIKHSDIEKAFNSYRIRQGLENAHENRCNILEGMLINKLLIHKGLVDSVEVTDEEIEDMVKRQTQYLTMQYGSKENLLRENNLNSEELHDVLFDMLYDQTLTQRVQYNLTSKVTVTPREVQAFYDRFPKDSLAAMKLPPEYELAEIVLQPSVSESERDRVRQQLAELRERIVKGEKFAMLATLYSQDPGSATKGGELGFTSRGVWVPEFESAAFALKPGEVSPIVESKFGFHIIQLIERRGNMVNARHILLMPKVSPEDLLRTRILLDSIAQEIRLGHISFEEAANQYSDAPTKSHGGAMTNQNTLSSRFTKEDVSAQYPGIPIASMQEGDISNATQMTDEDSQDLFRIVKVVRYFPEHTPNMSDDYDRLLNATLQEKKNEAVLDWAQKQIKNTYIRLSDEYKDCNFQINWVK